MPSGAAKHTLPARRVALMNQKGGVGKTTTTVNLAAALARAGRPTLVVDLDPQAHATLHLGVDPAALERSLYDVLVSEEVAPALVLHEAEKNLALLPAHTDLAAAEGELAQSPDRNQRLSRALERMEGLFRYVLIDCPPSLGTLTLNALACADEVLIPMQSHFLALQGVGKLLETVGAVRQSLNPRLAVTGVVLCAHDPSSAHAREVVADLESFFAQSRDAGQPWSDAGVLRPPVRRNIKLAECPSFGKTIFAYAPQAPGAEDYAALAAGLMKTWDAHDRERAAPPVHTPASRATTNSPATAPAAAPASRAAS
jgi:chromosome partitioning protein